MALDQDSGSEARERRTDLGCCFMVMKTRLAEGLEV